jgi:hypothetical protein
MALRIGFDLDGTLADFGSTYRDIERSLFGPGEASGVPDPDSADAGEQAAEDEEPADPRVELRRARRRRDTVWQAIRSIPDFWTTLAPIDAEAVRRIHAAMLAHRWEVVFVTQRPSTAGETVQRQTQRWLVAQGFDMPSVVVLEKGRGHATAALGLHYLVDDTARNCVDVIADSRARPILVLRDPDPVSEASARKLGIGVAHSIAECIEILVRATEGRLNPGLLTRLARKMGWRR